MGTRKRVCAFLFSNPGLYQHSIAKLRLINGVDYSSSRRQFSVVNGEAIRGKQTTEQLYKHVDGLSTGAEVTAVKDQLDPFSLVSDEISPLTDRLRSMVVTEVPKLASAAGYFFKKGVEGKRFRPTVLLLMATALNMPVSMPSVDRLSPTGVIDNLETELRRRQQCIAEITEMIHVASLLHDDVLDDADTRRGVSSLNSLMGNKLAVLAGNFLLSRAFVVLASLENDEIVSLIAEVVEHLITGETMQMTTTSEQRLNMQYYMEKTYYKTASLISNSCKAISLLTEQTAETSTLAYDYGKHLGIITAPLLFAIEEFPQLGEVLQRGFDNPADIDLALDYLGRSQGIQRAKDLALKHARLAVKAIDSLPENDDEDVRQSRQALVDLTKIVIKRTK
ncbi:solanesyl-diphosphate synthase 1, mitochondrial isoform X2 [Spinacia oleracea]|uniref:Solanesyl-diphosphate synthase 1, mitochondrial isoform X2 n=1 Tax=Spinacia oleracea TaxID=3562 RepID=A0ABM3RB67_SPIOL|nr:solanesyl-diphosphate synthase 1, mitochondrial-like isoform X2 [Spinacia oleracea]